MTAKLSGFLNGRTQQPAVHMELGTAIEGLRQDGPKWWTFAGLIP